MAERTIEKILNDVKTARVNKVPLNWTEKDLSEDISIVCGEIIVELPKCLKGNKAAKKRVRDYTKLMETLGKDYRKASLK